MKKEFIVCENMSGSEIQQLIDNAAQAAGQVIFPKGTYRTGTLKLHTNSWLHFEDGAVLEGSRNMQDYEPGGWAAALLYAEDAENISITGRGVIDGCDCVNPDGEEGFRGPHAIRFYKCKHIKLEDITVQNAGNYGIFQIFCEDGSIHGVTVLAGHDGIHLQRCKHYVVTNCICHTGDDSAAGSGNEYIEFANCDMNSSCNAFRFGGAHIHIHDIRITSPGEYIHKISKNNVMDCAFVYFSPKDRHDVQEGTDWLIENVQVEGATCLYNYDYDCGIWQDGMPLNQLTMRNVRATGLLQPMKIFGHRDKNMQVSLENITLSFRNRLETRDVFNIAKIGKIRVQNLEITCDEDAFEKPEL